MASRRKVDVSPTAHRDFFQIVAWYRANLGVGAAARVNRSLREGLARVATISLSAAARSDFPSDVYRVVARQHLILFVVRGDTALVTRMLHGARDVPTVLDEE